MHAHIGPLKTEKPLAVSAAYMRSSFDKESHDFINVEIREPEVLNSVYIRVPVEHVIAFHAAMVDALAPHVDEQRAAELEKPLAKAAPRDPAIVQHGINCTKAEHNASGGYLHGAEDDMPYDVDGLSYCGRCHGSLA